MHILITGGAGFIGSHLAEYHLKKGDKIHVVDNLSTGSTDNILPFSKNPNFRFDKEDILLWNGLEKAVAWADRVYHMAAVVGVFRVLHEFSEFNRRTFNSGFSRGYGAHGGFQFHNAMELFD